MGLTTPSRTPTPVRCSPGLTGCSSSTCQRANGTATATPAADAGLDVVVNLVAGPAASCRAVPPVCLAKADRGLRGEPDTASFVNASAMSQPVLIVVGSYSPSPGDADFTLSTVTLPPPPGDSCATATPLTSGTTLAAQTLTPTTATTSMMATGAPPRASSVPQALVALRIRHRPVRLVDSTRPSRTSATAYSGDAEHPFRTKPNTRSQQLTTLG